MPEAPIFVAEDDHQIAGLIRFHLHAAGYKTVHFPTGEKLIERATVDPPCMFLLDVMLPGVNGLQLCRLIRNKEALARTPIIFISARISEDDMLEGFEAGADDYITKPFSPREMVARVQAVLRRYKGLPGPRISFDHVEIDSAAMILRVNGQPQQTTTIEFRLLEFLARSPGMVFSRDHLREAVWGDSNSTSHRSVDVYISKLREKIEADPERPRYLQTVRGTGYKLVLSQSEAAQV